LPFSPALADGVLYFGGIDGNLYTVDAATGRERWKFAAEHGITSAPTVAGALVHFGSLKGLYTLDAANGQLKWSYTTERIVTSTPAVSGGLIYFGGWDGNLYAVQ
jgi:outer membrane protein assembly factor BamB